MESELLSSKVLSILNQLQYTINTDSSKSHLENFVEYCPCYGLCSSWCSDSCEQTCVEGCTSDCSGGCTGCYEDDFHGPDY